MADDRRGAVDVLRGSRILAYSIGALSLIAGIVLIFWTDRTLVFVARLAGVLLLVVGLSEVFEAITTSQGLDVGLFLLRGVINVGFGVALLLWSDITLSALVWLFGLDLVITAIVAFVLATQVGADQGRSTLVLRGAVSLVFGIMVMAWPSTTLTVLAILVGIQLILFGLLLLFSGWQLSKATVVEAV
ncbi:MAG: DUF308 domain-containing protein [Acidimicrobiales bacterium]